MEWLLGLIAGLIGALFGNWFALGRDLRKERNEARYPVWKWFDSRNPGYGETLPKGGLIFDDLIKYKSVVPNKEWKKYLDHMEKIEEIREPFAPTGYDAAGGIISRPREPNDEELRLIHKHWNDVVHLLRHRGFS